MEEHQENIEQKVVRKNKIGTLLRTMFGGKVLLNERITKHYKAIALVFFLSFVFVGIRLNNEHKMREIQKLENALMYQKEDFYRLQGKFNEEFAPEKIKNKIELNYPDTPSIKY